MCTKTHQNPSPPVLIFGCGYVGERVAELAAAAGHPVSVLTRNPAKAAALADRGYRVVQGDLATTDWHGALDAKGAWAVNTVSAGGGGVEGYRRSYLEGMRSLLAWGTGGAEGLARLAYTSSTSVYPQDGDGAVAEGDSAEPTTETGRILRDTEEVALAASGSPLRVAVLRLVGIYGPERHHLLDQLRHGGGEVAGQADTWLNLIHREDAATAVWSALSQSPEPRGIYHVTDGHPARRGEVVAWLSERLSLPAPRFSGQPASGRRQVTPNRRILPGRLGSLTGWSPVYPDFRRGYASLLGA